MVTLFWLSFVWSGLHVLIETKIVKLQVEAIFLSLWNNHNRNIL